MTVEVAALLFAAFGLLGVLVWLVQFRLWLELHPGIGLGRLLVEGMAGLVVFLMVGLIAQIIALGFQGERVTPLTRTIVVVAIGVGAWIQVVRFFVWWIGRSDDLYPREPGDGGAAGRR